MQPFKLNQSNFYLIAPTGCMEIRICTALHPKPISLKVSVGLCYV